MVDVRKMETGLGRGVSEGVRWAFHLEILTWRTFIWMDSATHAVW